MAYLGRKGASAPLNSTDIPDGIIIAADIADVITLVTPTFTNIATANGGLQTDNNSKVKQKGAFMQSSTHQALTLGV